MCEFHQSEMANILQKVGELQIRIERLERALDAADEEYDEMSHDDAPDIS